MELDLLIQKILIGNGYSPAMARFFAAVSRHETGNYSSAVFRNYNNLFGMKDAEIRATTNRRDQDKTDYAEYVSAADSVRDLVLYLLARDYAFHYDSPRDLVMEMKKKGYFEADFSEYLGGVERALPKVSIL